MRLHRLEIQAFGPFAERVHIDFDRLTEQGLFLLHGPTGAGKTSILDAICFALYARVPGARQEARRLRSDHAAEGTAPEVKLEFSARGRRFEVTRSPEWQRPRKRGEGTTPEKARTLLREKVDGDWVEGSRDHAESSLQITELLGMKVEQFTRVVMLPQGDFASFLRADAGERKTLLQQLFATERFEQVEAWLIERDREAKAALDGSHREWRELLAQAEQSASSVPGTDLIPSSADSAVEAGAIPIASATDDPEAIEARLELLVARTRAAVDAASYHAADTARLASEAAIAFEERHDLTTRHAALARVEEAQEEFARDEPRRAEDGRRLAAHRSALPLSARMERCDELTSASESLGARAAEILARLGIDGPAPADPEGPGDATLSKTLRNELEALSPDIVRLSDLLDQEAEQERLEKEVAEQVTTLDALRSDLDRARERRDGIAGTRDALRQEIDRLRELAATEPGRAALLAQARERLTAATEALTLSEDLARKDTEVRDLREAALNARERHLDIRRARLEHMASELAQLLEDGDPCPVCGASEHPHLAERAPGAVSPQEETLAEQEALRATRAHEEALAELNTLVAENSAARARSGGLDADAAAELHRRAEEDHRAAADAAGAVSASVEREAALVSALASLNALMEQGQEQETRSEAAMRADSAALAALTERLGRARGEDGSLRLRLRRLEKRRDDLAEGLAVLSDQQAALKDLRKTLGAAEKAAVAAGFPDFAGARLAILPDREVAALGEAETAAAVHQADLRAELRRPEIRRAIGERDRGVPLPSSEELAASEVAAAEGREAATRAREVLAVAEGAATALNLKATELRSALRAAEPVRAAYRLAHRLADLSRGLGDNTLRMSLSSYVLAARLEAVAAAASERLTAMSDGRYTIGYTDALAGRGKKSGLGLDIIDGYTGLTRDPKTLSGGETFQASLALALGLADVVQAESGGVDLETLFVDEGFGTLDEQSLEKVMDILDGLRSGGRAVGVISHVPEMRARIPSQLPVVKTRHGSTLGRLTA